MAQTKIKIELPQNVGQAFTYYDEAYARHADGAWFGRACSADDTMNVVIGPYLSQGEVVQAARDLGLWI